MSFHGISLHNLDSKSRVFVPKRIQAKLPMDGSGQQAVVLGPGIERCVNLYTPEGWEARRLSLETQPFAHTNALRMQRFVFGLTFELALDKSSRLLIPEKLREYAGLDGEVALVGVHDRVEVWNAKRWAELESQASAEFDALAPRWAAGGWDAASGPGGAPVSGADGA